MTTYKEAVIAHYKKNWHHEMTEKVWKKGPVHELPDDFCILEFSPSSTRDMWTYATCCMSQSDDTKRIEIHIFSPFKTDELLELLTIVAHYHRTGTQLDLGHTVNFGKGWVSDSICKYGLISLPYLDGPDLENADIDGTVKNYWLIPITEKEREYKKQFGVESLEEKLEAAGFNYLDPNRSDVV